MKMKTALPRRTLLAAVPAALGTLLLDPGSRLLAQAPAAEPDVDARALPTGYPAQEPSAVREVVTVSHFSLERVRSLVDERAELAKSSWDWGFGDWESALGAASHTGNRDIAEYLIAHGARPDLFTAAMMGDLKAVQAFITGFPGIQTRRGPHGITLRRHAELGGEPAHAVLEYLDQLGDADLGPTNLPLELEQGAYVGTYPFGADAEDRFEVTVGSYDLLTIQRGEGTARTLFHQGDHTFHPAGAPSAKIRFQVEGDTVRALEIRNPDLLVTAIRRSS